MNILAGSGLSHIPLPIQEFYVELTNQCNFTCTFCPTRRMTRPTGFMDFSVFTTVMDDIANLGAAMVVPLHIVGEPLLHPRVVDAARYAVSRDVPVRLCTNGSLLHGQLLENLIKSDLPELSISLVANNSDSFTKDRKATLGYRAYYEIIMNAVSAFHQRSPKTKVKVSLIDTGSTRLLNFAKEIDQSFGDQSLHNILERVATDLRRTLGYETDSASIRDWIRRIKLGSPVRLEVAPKVFVETKLLLDWGNAFCTTPLYTSNRGYCSLGLQRMAGISCRGEFLLCGGDFNAETALGEITPQFGIQDFLNSKEAREIYTGFQQLRILHPYCQKCMGGPTWFSSVIRRIMSSYIHKYWLKKHPMREYNYRE